MSAPEDRYEVTLTVYREKPNGSWKWRVMEDGEMYARGEAPTPFRARTEGGHYLTGMFPIKGVAEIAEQIVDLIGVAADERANPDRRPK